MGSLGGFLLAAFFIGFGYFIGFKRSEPELQRVLNVISKIAMLQDPDEKDEAWSNVYTLSHSFSGTCGNPHTDWQEELSVREKELENY